MKRNIRQQAYFAGIGVALGTGVGVALGNIAIGAGIGVAFGTAIGAALNAMHRRR